MERVGCFSDEVYQTNSMHHQVSSLPCGEYGASHCLHEGKVFVNSSRCFSILKEGVSVEEVLNAGSLLQLQQGGISIQRRAYLEKEIQQHMAGMIWVHARTWLVCLLYMHLTKSLLSPFVLCCTNDLCVTCIHMC